MYVCIYIYISMNHWTIPIFLNLFILSFLFLSAIQASEFFGVPTWILVAACQSRHVVRRGHNLTVAGAVPGPLSWLEQKTVLKS